MKLVDANLLIYAHDSTSPFHSKARAWLEGLVASLESFLLAWTTVLAFVRITTHRKLLKEPQPGERFWTLFQTHCGAIRERGAGVMDVELAAFAIERNAELLTADGGFSRFTGLRFSNPLEPAQWIHENKSSYRY